MYFAQFTKIEIETFLVANGDITNWYCLQIDILRSPHWVNFIAQVFNLLGK